MEGNIQLALICVRAALSIGLAGLGAGIGIGSVGQGACLGLARNPEVQPKLMVFMILGMALIESLVILAFVIAFMIQGHQATLIKAGLKAAGIELE